jgi:hypothetical protein
MCEGSTHFLAISKFDDNAAVVDVSGDGKTKDEHSIENRANTEAITRIEVAIEVAIDGHPLELLDLVSSLRVLIVVLKIVSLILLLYSLLTIPTCGFSIHFISRRMRQCSSNFQAKQPKLLS